MLNKDVDHTDVSLSQLVVLINAAERTELLVEVRSGAAKKCAVHYVPLRYCEIRPISPAALRCVTAFCVAVLQKEQGVQIFRAYYWTKSSFSASRVLRQTDQERQRTRCAPVRAPLLWERTDASNHTVSQCVQAD